MKYSDIQVSPIKDNKYKVLTDIVYKDIIVPTGYRTNGADIPRIFWSFYPPNRSDYLPAVIVHDYLCDLELYGKADKYFEEIMELMHIKKSTRLIMVGAAKLFHRIMYRNTYDKW